MQETTPVACLVPGGPSPAVTRWKWENDLHRPSYKGDRHHNASIRLNMESLYRPSLPACKALTAGLDPHRPHIPSPTDPRPWIYMANRCSTCAPRPGINTPAEHPPPFLPRTIAHTKEDELCNTGIP